MDWQTIVVVLIVFAALIYAAKTLFAKTKSFSAKSDCGTNCGCGDADSKRISTKR